MSSAAFCLAQTLYAIEIASDVGCGVDGKLQLGLLGVLGGEALHEERGEP